MSGKRRLRPGSGSLLAMIVLNAIVGTIVLFAVFALFGLNSVFAQRAAQIAAVHAAARWNMLWPLVPGAAIGFGILWFCQVIVGRSRGVNWAASLFYGVGIAFGNVLLGALLNGILHGDPLMGLLFGLLALILVPANWAGMATFGAIMGLLNARFAAGWIARHYPRL